MGCSSFFYQPTQIVYTTPDLHGIDYESSSFYSLKNKAKLHFWYLKSSDTSHPPKSTVLYFHGNAQNLSAHFLFPAFLTKFGHDVFIFDYQGYGQSEGVASPSHLYDDGLAALEHAFKWHLSRNSERFIVYGHSLGGILAMRSMMDSEFLKKTDLLIVESSFSSYRDIAYDKISNIFFLWPLAHVLKFLVSDEMKVKGKVKNLSPVPLLIIHGDEDQVVPLKFGEMIYKEALDFKRVKFWKISGGGHGGLFLDLPKSEQLRRDLLNFMDHPENLGL